MSDAPTSAPTRDRTFDILKGVLIFAVVLLHSTGRSASKLAVKDSTSWWILKAINWGLCFAVPVFIFVSAYLWTRSQMRRDDWSGYFGRRVKSIVVPYAIWSVLYWFYRVWPEHAMAKHGLIEIGSRAKEALAGKAYFHLYFMIVLIQLAIFFPWIYRAVRALSEKTKDRPIAQGFAVMLAATLAVQYGVFAIYKAIFPFLYAHWRFQYPASIAFWYVTSLLPGVWIALNHERLAELRKPIAWIAPIVAAVLAVRIVTYEIELLQPKADISSFLYNGAIAFYALSMALALLIGCRALDRTRVAAPLAYLGRMSLQVYLIHPMVMFVMSGRSGVAIVTALPGSPLWSFALLMALSVGISEGLSRLKLDAILFGRG